MRLVLDTNTVISGLLWKGPPHALLTAAREDPNILLHSSPRLLAELADVLGRRKLGAAVLAGGESPEALFQRFLLVVNIVVPAPIAPVVVADPDDDHVLACAIVTAAEALTRLPRRP